MLDARGDHACCDRCASAGIVARITRRRLLKAAVFRPAEARPGAGPDDAGPPQAQPQPGFATSGELPRAVTGTVVDVSPHFLVLSHGVGQERFALTPGGAHRWNRRRCGRETGPWCGCTRRPAAWPTGSGPTSAG